MTDDDRANYTVESMKRDAQKKLRPDAADEIVFVECPDCGNEQADMGRGVQCEECGYGPMPAPQQKG